MSKFYSLDVLKDLETDYHIIFGERSNGKTSAVLEEILKNWVFKGEKGAYLRRYDDHIKGGMATKIWSSISVERDLVNKYTKGEYTDVVYQSGDWFLAKYDDKLQRYIKQKESFCSAFALNTAERYKGTSYPEITTIVYDEFLSRERPIMNEFVEYNNVISTIVRGRPNVKIYMLGNTVNKYSTYFDEMGLDDIETMKPGDIKRYEIHGKNDKVLKLAVQYCKPNAEGKESDKFFLFDNKKLRMITDGDWEIPMHAHAPLKINPSNIIENFFVEFRGKVVQGDIVMQEDNLFIYMHKKTTPIKDDIKMLYRLEASPKINHAKSLTGPVYRNKVSAHIGRLIREGQIYYQDNSIGELIRNYQQLASQSETDLF